jgi:hypothetical protein
LFRPQSSSSAEQTVSIALRPGSLSIHLLCVPPHARTPSVNLFVCPPLPACPASRSRRSKKVLLLRRLLQLLQHPPSCTSAISVCATTGSKRPSLLLVPGSQPRSPRRPSKLRYCALPNLSPAPISCQPYQIHGQIWDAVPEFHRATPVPVSLPCLLSLAPGPLAPLAGRSPTWASVDRSHSKRPSQRSHQSTYLRRAAPGTITIFAQNHTGPPTCRSPVSHFIYTPLEKIHALPSRARG